MKGITVLKNIIICYYYIMLLGLFGLIASFPSGIINSGAFKNNFMRELPEGEDLKSIKIYIIALLFLLIYVLFIYAIWLLKNSLPELIEGNYFSKLVIKNFKLIGVLLLCSSIGYLITIQVVNLLLLGKLKFWFDDAVFFQIIMGLFFLLLSKVFLKGKILKQENDLTI